MHEVLPEKYRKIPERVSNPVSNQEKNTGEKMAINLTQKAADEVARQLKDSENTYLRLGVKGGGCSGFTYVVELATEKRPGDQEMESLGIKILSDMKSYLYLNGMTVDLQETLMQKQFIFINPNAGDSCGCGTSFSPK